ncbi:MAG: DEAD/DEAH box helicase [Candidatus Eisenbacteria bacterium]|uniref:DEAD/DEAH box helicase n=1 Tax=Eiseniibacteriota bacterium TaxID=2212470 RepID=A0A938BP26_UNCEI|nr:DEAD/DEAH box helicase [Candidatus Eisenbacteria bacterium]
MTPRSEPRAGVAARPRRRRASRGRREQARDRTLLGRVEDLAAGSFSLVHAEELPERAARFGELSRPLPAPLAGALAAAGIERLYVHQAAAVDGARRGEHFVVVTGTASGKTLCYQLPLLERWLAEPQATSLLLFPTKALAQDQLKSLAALQEAAAGTLPFLAGTYDGDTPARQRAKLRDEAALILTNPDMLHSGILPNHARWARFFTSLRYVVCDEIHVYRGIFGSNVANVLRRLRRICRHYGSDPLFICSSATIANPRELAENLTGRPFRLVDDDGAPRGRKHFVLWNPRLISEATMDRRSSNLEARDLMASFVRSGHQTIAFVRARQVAEVLLRYAREELERDGGGVADRIRSYRGGYLPEERRAIERALFDGELSGVISTNALELGIDVGALDVALLVGYPGTIASTWQQAGRAGRTAAESLAVLVAHNTPIDQYLMRHPEYFFRQSPENAVIDPDNAHILLGHLRAAAYELPVTPDDEGLFGEYAPAILGILAEAGEVQGIKGRWYFSTSGYPAADISLRNASDQVFLIADTAVSPSPGELPAALARRLTRPGRIIGTLDEPSAFAQLHAQAIYLHEGQSYFVDHLDLSERVAYVHPVKLEYYTQSISDSRIRILATQAEQVWRTAESGFGDLAVSEKVYMFKKIRFETREALGFGPCDLPVQTLETEGCWVTPPPEALAEVVRYGRVPVEGLWGIANVLRDVVTLHAMCDVMDVGTTVDSRGTGLPSIFLYDRYPGGLGFAHKAFGLLDELFAGACEMIAGCPCEGGCPSCVGAPVLPHSASEPDGSGRGRIPDKEAALVLLHHLLQREPYLPKGGVRPWSGSGWDPVRSRAPGEEAFPEKQWRTFKPLPPELEQRLRRSLGRMAERSPGP